MSRWFWLSLGVVACHPPNPPAEPNRVASSSNPNEPAPLEIAAEPDEPEAEPELPPEPPLPPPVNPCAVSVPSGCQALVPMNVSADANRFDAGRAGDGDACSVWNAGGFAPHSVTFDLGVITTFRVVTLIPEMTPNGNVEHLIELSDDGKRFAVAHRIQAPLRSGIPETLRLPRAERARFVRVSSKKSPSWIAWREIALFQCP